MIRNSYKKLFPVFSLLISFILLFSSFLGVKNNVKAEETAIKEITVFSWEDYIDEGYDSADEASEVLLDRFEPEELEKSILDIFEEKTGIKVNYYSFATNEEMYNELLKDPTAVDLICPSEYMIMKMRSEDLIKPYAMPNNYVEHGSPYIKSVFDTLGLNTTDGKAYAIGYMWGTMGLIYNATKFNEDDFTNWSNLLDQKFKGRLTIKDSLRDSYIIAVAIVHEQELLKLKSDLERNKITEKEYRDELFKVFNDVSPETVAKVEKTLIELKSNLYGFEVDAGKNDLLTGKIDVNFAWSGDAVYSMYEADESGLELRYAVPEEGSNVWFDGWVMTKDANEALASEFLDFICSPEIAVRNMDYIGYTSCIGGEEVFNYVSDNYSDDAGDIEVDLGYFFGDGDYTLTVSDGEDGYYRHLYAQYADEETIMRCAVMDNFSNEQLELVNEMWNKVKLITLSNTTIILIVVAMVLAIAGVVVFVYREKLFGKRISEKDRKIKKGLKVISKEQI